MKTVVSNFSMHQIASRAYLSLDLLGLNIIISDSVDLEWDPRICISKTFLDDADAGGLGATL